METALWADAFLARNQVVAKGACLTDQSDPVEIWREKRRVVYGRSDDDIERGNCFDLSCQERGEIEVISYTDRIYGCLAHGIVHRCSQEKCSTIFIGSDGMRICYMSGMLHGAKFEDSLWGKPVVGHQESSSQDHYDPFHSEDVSSPSEGGGGGTKRKRRARRRPRPQPTPEQLLPRGPALEPAPTSIGLPVSRQAFSDEDLDDQLNDPVQDRVYKDQTTPWRPKKMKRNFAVDDTVLRLECITIVDDLIYDADARGRINKAKMSSMRQQGFKRTKEYYKGCKRRGILPNYLTGLDRWFNCVDPSKLLETPERDLDRVNGLCTVCIDMWHLVLKTPSFRSDSSGFHFRNHVLSCLYLMRSNFRHPSGRILLHQDDFLVRYLPAQNDLDLLKPPTAGNNKPQRTYGPGDVTKGRKNLRSALNSGIAISAASCPPNRLSASAIIPEDYGSASAGAGASSELGRRDGLGSDAPKQTLFLLSDGGPSGKRRQDPQPRRQEPEPSREGPPVQPARQRPARLAPGPFSWSYRQRGRRKAYP